MFFLENRFASKEQCLQRIAKDLDQVFFKHLVIWLFLSFKVSCSGIATEHLYFVGDERMNASIYKSGGEFLR